MNPRSIGRLDRTRGPRSRNHCIVHTTSKLRRNKKYLGKWFLVCPSSYRNGSNVLVLRNFKTQTSFIFLSPGCEAQRTPRAAFVSFAVRYEFQYQRDGTTDMTINAAFLSHRISNTIQGSNLWRLRFFGAQNPQGTGFRANQINQLLTPVQASKTATPGQNLTFVVNARWGWTFSCFFS